MIHVGDITKLSGRELAPVDVVIGGSPCQDLSIAGQRAGLNGARSGLFMEQMRIVREMHAKYGKDYPRFILWENVPGAFSSNKGTDFRAVLEEIATTAEGKQIIIPQPKKWTKAGFIMGDGYSIAWQTLDAQYFGVPQRRKRIALVADFRSESADKILFDPARMCWDLGEGTEARQDIAAGAGSDSTGSVFALQGNGIDRALTAGCNGSGVSEGTSYTLNVVDRHAVAYSLRGNTVGRTPEALVSGSGVSEDLSFSLLSEKVHAVAYMYESHPNDSRISGPVDVAPAVVQQYGTGGNNVPLVTHVYESDMQHGEFIGPVDTAPTVMSNYSKRGDNAPAVCEAGIARRLTPLECERLQGYPDYYTDIGTWYDSKGKKRQASDTQRYKALGNSIALPAWDWLLRRIANQYPWGATLGSLFDGIGGFPLLWERINGDGSCLWASEVDEFCIAVTNKRINGKEK